MAFDLLAPPSLREAAKYYLADFFRYRLPRTPITENVDAKKLAELRGTPTPNRKSANFIWEKIQPKGLKMLFVYKIRLKTDQQSYKMDQKGLKIYEKAKK